MTKKIYVLEVDYDEFEYDSIAYAVVLADNEIEAVNIARLENDVKWDVKDVIELHDVESRLIKSYIHPG